MERQKTFLLIATDYITAEATTVKRLLTQPHEDDYGKTKVTRIDVACPPAVKMYCKCMGGVDKNDQLIVIDKSRRTPKWTSRMFIKAFMWCAKNAYVIWKTFHPPKQTAKCLIQVSFNDFLEKLVDQLLACYTRDIPRRAHAHSSGSRSSTRSIDSIRLNSSLPHLVVFVAKSEEIYKNMVKPCPVCAKATKRKAETEQVAVRKLPRIARPQTICEDCMVALCVCNGRNCFKKNHTKLNY